MQKSSVNAILFSMRLRYVFIPLLVLAVVFLVWRYSNNAPLASSVISFQPGDASVASLSLPITNVPGCTRTTGIIDANILGIGQPAGLVTEDLPYLKDLGVKWTRTDLWWESMEPSEGIYTWNELDGIVRVLNENKIKLLLSITYVPDWVWAKDKQGRWDAMYMFAKELATRNRGKVRYYEIFNEPNLPSIGFFRERDKVDVSVYLDFLAAANKGIHEADPSAVVVLGGLSGVSDSRTYMDAEMFLKQLYEQGGRDCFDVLAYHPYEAFGAVGKFREKADTIRAFTALYRDSTKTIWFNELGTTEESVKADYLNQVRNELSAVPAWFWFSLRDFSKDDMFGLLTANYQKRPAYELFKQIIKSR